MTVQTFAKWLFIAVAFCIFLFSGGCAFFPAMDCMFSRCDPLSGFFIIPGIVVAFLSASIFLKCLKHSGLNNKATTIIYSIFGVAMWLTIGTLAYFFFKDMVHDLYSGKKLTGSAILTIISMTTGYFGTLFFFAVITTKAGIRLMLGKPDRGQDQ